MSRPDYGKADTPAGYQRRRYTLHCPEHGELGEVVGALAVGRILREHGCVYAYAEPARLRQASRT